MKVTTKNEHTGAPRDWRCRYGFRVITVRAVTAFEARRLAAVLLKCEPLQVRL